jgi:membrane protease YdiL (CAAX protease family)
MMEEVAFRGALDSHVRHPGEGSGFATRAYGFASAVYVSALWGLWHHPVVPGPVWELLPAQVFMGPILSLFWRRSGNLMVPAFAHALNDAVRNAISGGVP